MGRGLFQYRQTSLTPATLRLSHFAPLRKNTSPSVAFTGIYINIPTWDKGFYNRA